MEPYTRNGGMIGRTLDFEDEERYITGTNFANVEFVAANSIVDSTSLTLPAGLEEGDLVILVATSDADQPPYRPSGYTNIYDEQPSSTGALACYKFMGATPDASISGLNNDDRIPYIAMVFRGVDTTTPLDVAYTQSSTASSGMPNPPSITTVSDGCMIVAVGHLDDDNITATAPSGYTLAGTQNSSPETGATVMAAYLLQTTAGAEDPGVFGGGGSDENEARTLALRPAAIPVYGNKKNSGIWDLETVYENNAPPPPGQEAFTTPGFHSWTAPPGVTSICVVCVGSGAGGQDEGSLGSHNGGGGGGLGWKNNISVVPGNSYSVFVGGFSTGVTKDGFDSFFINRSTVAGFGGGNGGNTAGGGYVGDGGGNGGAGGSGGDDAGGGGGAGGYSGNGGDGGDENTSGSSGAGGGGGGGGAGGASDSAGGGGGVGILGEGTSGSGGSYTGGNAFGGTGGSGGTDGTNGDSPRGNGGAYGGGGGGADNSNSEWGYGGNGAVRIIWGYNRAFPSTNTGDL